MLNLLYAQLELTHGYIRATTPMYQCYDITPRNPGVALELARDKYPAAATTFKLLKPKKTGWSIDVIENATDEWPRERIAAQITSWESAGLVDVSGRQVRAVSDVLKEFMNDGH